jgi:hypothetical protein
MTARNNKKVENNAPYLIANPAFNTVFKRLMLNKRIAKYFFSVLFQEKITEIEVDPKRPIPDKIIHDTFRIDFWGRIQTEENKDRKLFIEVIKTEKEKNYIKSGYLNERFTRTEWIDGKEVLTPMAIVYILGFEIKNIKYPCIVISTEVQDAFLKETIKSLSLRDPFGLTNFIIQTKRVNDENCKMPLEELLSLFKQDHFAWENTKSGKYYLHQSEDPEMQYLLNELHEMIVNPDIRKEIETEEKILQ